MLWKSAGSCCKLFGVLLASCHLFIVRSVLWRGHMSVYMSEALQQINGKNPSADNQSASTVVFKGLS